MRRTGAVAISVLAMLVLFLGLVLAVQLLGHAPVWQAVALALVVIAISLGLLLIGRRLRRPS